MTAQFKAIKTLVQGLTELEQIRLVEGLNLKQGSVKTPKLTKAQRRKQIEDYYSNLIDR